MDKNSTSESSVNFPEMEKKILKDWYEKGIVDKYLSRNKKSTKYFSFIDGPITANNSMGVHHAWGRTYKDLWQRFFNMRGFKERFQNGFDCQGLWVEVEVEKELHIKNKMEIENLVAGNKEASIAKFVNLCKERVLKFSKIQTEQTKRLGNFMDWEHSYYTMSDNNNYMIWHYLKECFKRGWIYKGRESVPWCPRCQTAISQHEMLTEDYKEVVHESIYLELPVVGKKDEYLLVWTTTPWTIPANIAVAVDKKLDYSLVEGTSGDKFWIAKDLISSVFGKDYKKIVKTVKGKELAGLRYQGPFDQLEAAKSVAEKNPDKFHTVVLTDDNILPITTIEGTGLVHTAVSAGSEDFKLGKKYGLPMIPVIDDTATYLPHLGFLTGQNAKKHPEIIFNFLKEQEKLGKNWIFKLHMYKHRYPACWRCKEELVWKVADEWYISMDKVDPTDSQKRTLRSEMMDVAKKVHWLPSFGLERELDWLSNMHDWLISKKNRYWGLALPIYECPKCHNFEVIGSYEELKERAVSGWSEFEGHTPHKPWIDKVKIKCAKCQTVVSRIADVGNVWLDAGIVPFSTISSDNKSKPLYLTNREDWRKWFPADFITESFPGQFKNWFYSLIAMATVLEKSNPSKTILGYALACGKDGQIMHKSNPKTYISFDEGAEKAGSDVMRWVFVRQNPTQNLLFGWERTDEARRKFIIPFWNVFKYFEIQAQLTKWNGANKEKASSHILDKWIVSRLTETVVKVTDSLTVYDAFSASGKIESLVDDLSVWYVRRSREREDKGNLLTTLQMVLLTLTKITAPFIPFLSDEIYLRLTKQESVHLADWPEEFKQQKVDEKLLEQMNLVREIVENGHRIRKEKMIKVRQPLQKVIISGLPSELSSDLTQLTKDELNIKEVNFKKGEKELKVELDTKLTPELKEEGVARDLVRKIQSIRKQMGLRLDEQVIVYAPSWPKKYEDYIKSKTLAQKLIIGRDLKVIGKS